MSLSVITTNNQAGSQTVTVRPVSVAIGQTFTLELFGVQVSYTATAATANNVVAGLLAAIAASSDPEWSLVTTQLNTAGDALLITYSVTAGTLRIWRGDAPAVAQVTRVSFPVVNVGDSFTLSINGTVLTVTAATASAAAVAAAFVALVDDTTVPEWQEIVATVDGQTLLLTAATAGVPFQVTADAGRLILVETLQDGQPQINQIQTFKIPVSAAGTFTVTLGDQTTSALSVGASAATVQTALQALSTIGAGNAAVSLSTDSNDSTYTVTFQGSLAGITVAPLRVKLSTTKPPIRTIQDGSSSGTPKNEKQTIDLSGLTSAPTFTLTLNGQTTVAIAANATGTTIATEISNLTGVDYVSAVRVGDLVTVEFAGDDENANQNQMTASVYSGSVVAIIQTEVTITQAAQAAQNEQQRITLSGAPTGGTWTATFNGSTTSAIAYNAAAATVQTALQALSTIGSGNAAVTGSAGGPYTVTFQGSKAAANQPAITCNAANLTGGSTDRMTLATVTASSGPNHWDTAGNWTPAGVPVDFDRVRFEFGDSDCLYGLNQAGVMLTEIEIRSSYTGNIGLPRINENGYAEYRTRDLTIHCPSILIGHGDGSGSGKIQLNTLDTTAWIEIRSTGGSQEQGVPAVTWFGDNEASEIILKDGDFGTAVWSDQLAVLNKVEQYGGTLRLDHATLNALYAPGQTLSAHETTLGGKPLEL